MSEWTPRVPRPRRSALAGCSIAALVAMLVLRLTGPSDLYDQTQPKTVSYTTDIIVHGGTHWILPVERGELPATKPPLYNWLAAPAVRWLGFNSEIAHKLPSIAAMLGCWLIIVRLGRSIGETPAVGWLAGLVFVSNYAIFKLGYLARPDMLLTLWALIAWMCATSVFSGAARPALNVMAFWTAVALAGLTKGPAVMVVVVYVCIAARVIGGRWSAIRALYPIVGVLFAALVCGVWVYTVWRIDPAHVKQELWFNEIYGRVTGTGEEGTHHGTRSWLRELPYQLFYFVTRFLPWSFPALWATILLWRRRHARVEGQRSSETRWMQAAALFMLVTIGLFTLSTGKRADYVAVAIPQASMLAAWWMLRASPPLMQRRLWLAPATAGLSLGLVSYYDHQQVWAPQYGFGDAIRRFADEATLAMRARPAPALSCAAGQSHLQAMLGIANADQRREVADWVRKGQPFWVVAGRTQSAPLEFDMWLSQHRLPARAERVVRSEELPRDQGWPQQVTLWRVTPE